MIDAQTKLYCLLGKPARHSLSPAMHNSGFNAKKMNCAYVAFEPENLQKAIDGLRALGVGGFNLTMPFKTEAINYLDEVDETARQIGAVNTVVNSAGKLVGHNTDGIGAIAALRKVTQISGKKVLLLGAGGAGRAIAHYLRKENADITISDRSFEKAQALSYSAGTKLIVLEKIDSLDGFDILINASPSGMKPNINEIPLPPSLLKKGLVVFDIVYEPPETGLLREAKKRGCKTINGLEMLLEQGYAAFRLFTGKDAPKKEMKNAVLRGMKK